MSIKVRRFDFDAFWGQIHYPRNIECLGFDYEHRSGFVSAYFMYSPSEISDYVAEESEASKHYCHNLELDDQNWRLNYDEELKGLTEVEARKKYQNDEIERIIFDYSQNPSLPRFDIDGLALFYDEHSGDIKAGFERWWETYTHYRSKPIRLAHYYYSEGEVDQNSQDHKLYKAFAAAYAIRHWLVMYQEILDFNRGLSKNNEKYDTGVIGYEVHTMGLEKIMAEEPFVVTTIHSPDKPSVKPEPASEQLSLPINHESEYILIKDKARAYHFHKRNTAPGIPKQKLSQLKISQKSKRMTCKRIQRFAELIAVLIFPCLQKRREAKKQERIKDEAERIKRFLNREWRMIKIGHGEHEDGSFFSFEEYQHKDGRTATRFNGSSCTDPDLKDFLFQEALERMERKQNKRNR